jgi:hypothetical protein
MGKGSIMKYILLKDNKLTKLIASQKSRTELNQVLQSLYDYDTILEVPEDFQPRIGADINEYDESLKYKSQEQRIIEGFIPVPEGYEIKDGEIIEIKEPEKTPKELLAEKKEQAIRELSDNCNDKRIEIIDDKRIMNVLTGATTGYPEYMTAENVGKVIELFKNIYHTYKPQIETAKSIEEVEGVVKGIVFPDLDYITSVIKQEA